MIKQHERVVLRTDVPAEGLTPGDVGTVVHVYPDGKAFEVEFVTLEGRTPADRGKLQCRKDFPYQSIWNGKRYATKQVRPVFADEPDAIVIVTVYTYYH